jgi:ParE toxin of type II toxin-antitoxin system, parDE
MPREFRERVVAFGNSGYVVLYRYDSNQVTVVSVRHAREAGY